MTKEALRLALEALIEIRDANIHGLTFTRDYHESITAIKAALEAKDEPVAWLLTDKKINSLQVDSIQRLIDRLKHAHHTDLCVRINGQDEWFQADWLKHMVRATPPQRTWVGLTPEEIDEIIETASDPMDALLQTMDKLKEKNGNA
jgi:hypothetical protein